MRLPAYIFDYHHGKTITVNREFEAERHTAVVCGTSGRVGGDELISENKALETHPRILPSLLLCCAPPGAPSALHGTCGLSASAPSRRPASLAEPWRPPPGSFSTRSRTGLSTSAQQGSSGSSWLGLPAPLRCARLVPCAGRQVNVVRWIQTPGPRSEMSVCAWLSAQGVYARWLPKSKREVDELNRCGDTSEEPAVCSLQQRSL